MVLCPNPGCPSKGTDFAILGQHLRQSPSCKPTPVITQQPPLPEQPSEPVDIDTANTVFSNKFLSVLMKGFNDRHYFNYVKAGHLDHVNSMMMEAFVELEHHVIPICSAASSVVEAKARLQGIFQLVRGQIAQVHSAKARTSYNKTKAKAPYVPPKVYKSLSLKAARKGAVRISLIELLTRIMQRDAAARVRVHATHTHTHTCRSHQTGPFFS